MVSISFTFQPILAFVGVNGVKMGVSNPITTVSMLA